MKKRLLSRSCVGLFPEWFLTFIISMKDSLHFTRDRKQNLPHHKSRSCLTAEEEAETQKLIYKSTKTLN